MSCVGRSLWLPDNLDILIKDRAAHLGVKYNNVIIDALHKSFGLDRDPLVEIAMRLSIWINSYHLNFPEDIVLQAFKYIESDPSSRSAYFHIVSEGKGPKAQSALNRRISQMVRQLARGKTVGKKIPTKECRLIKSYHRLKWSYPLSG